MLSGKYTWTETNDAIKVLIPLKGVSPKKVDVFTASTILKVAYSPFLIDLDLHAEIEVEKCRAVLKEGTLLIHLAKKDGNHVLWGQLCFEGSADETKQRREKALQDRQEQLKQQMEKLAAKKAEDERMVFQQHMELQCKEQQRMDDAKAMERKNAEEEMYKTFSEMKIPGSSSSNPSDRSSNAPEMIVSTEVEKGSDPPQDGLEDSYDLPPPRAVVHTNFKHTQRFFKTPARESAAKQEQEFLVKNRSNLNKNALLNVDKVDDVAVWLKAKGDEFKACGDYSSAINAYSDALNADESMIEVLAGRAECFLQHRQGANCIKDCLEVLAMNDFESQIPDVNERMQFEKETRIRLGMAYCLSKDYDNAKSQFEEARELDQTDKTVQESILCLMGLMEANKLKVEADQLYSGGNFSEASHVYTKAIDVESPFLPALINRAACYLAMQDPSSCIEDSSRALELLSQGRQPTSNILESLQDTDSQTKQKWKVTVLCRRAAAKRLENDGNAALEDLAEALKHAKQGSIDTIEIEQEIASLRKGI